jgi:hypothetical protein
MAVSPVAGGAAKAGLQSDVAAIINMAANFMGFALRVAGEVVTA